MLKINLPLCFLYCAVFIAPLQAQTNEYIANNSPAKGRYMLNGNGTVTDVATGLIWQRCSLGQVWDTSVRTCTGENADRHSWDEALQQSDSNTFADKDDWRLPNVEELRSIVAYDRHSPAINSSVFPSTSGLYWSSSPYASSSYSASWAIDFNTGGDSYYHRDWELHVLLVRSAEQNSSPLAIDMLQ